MKMLENKATTLFLTDVLTARGQCAILINNNYHPITKRDSCVGDRNPKTGKMKVILQSGMTGIAWKARNMRSEQARS